MSYCVDGKLILANLNTLETAEKTVVETYVRKVDKLVHLTINGEEIVTTDNHPFYVQGRGFIEAGSLLIGDKLVSANGEDLFVEDYSVELTEESVSVYNFQVDDFHTYFVGDSEVWVHNVDCMPTEKQKGFVKSKENSDGSITVTKKIDSKNVDIRYTKADDGHYYPRFEEYADYKNPNLKTDFSKPIKVDGKMTGKYSHDARLINQQLGLSETPTGYVWHHLEDGQSMLLVQQKIHSIKFGGFTHKGGASIIRSR